MKILHDKQQIIIHEDEVYVPASRNGKIGFDPDNFDIVELRNDWLKSDAYKWLYTKDIALTIEYQEYNKLKAQQKNTVSLLREALLDESLPDINYFPFWKTNDNIWSIDQRFSQFTWRVEFVKRIRWLDDKESIPYLREILFHNNYEYENKNNRYIHIKNALDLKLEAIQSLAKLWAKDILIEYLLQIQYSLHKTRRSHTLIKHILSELLWMWLADEDLSMLIKLCEHFEWADTNNRGYDELYLQQLYSKRGNIVKGLHYEWLIKEFATADSPIQRLLCKNIAYIKSIQAVRTLEDLYTHSTYDEFQECCLFGIEHRLFLHEYDLNVTWSMSISLFERQKVKEKYWSISFIWSSNKPSARTNRAEIESMKEVEQDDKETTEQWKKKRAKAAEYYKSLQPWDSIMIHIPYDMSTPEVPGIVIENDGETLLIESRFRNKKNIWRRSFAIYDGFSKWPAFFVDGEPQHFSVIVPRVVDNNPIPKETHIPIIWWDIPSTHDKDGDLIF